MECCRCLRRERLLGCVTVHSFASSCPLVHPCPPQAASLEQLESGAAAATAEAARLGGELSAQAAALQERQAAQEAAAGQARAAEAQLRELRAAHTRLQAAQGALQAAHAEQGSSLRARLAASQQRLGELLAGQKGLATGAARAQEERDRLQAALQEQAALVRQLQQQHAAAEHEAATFRGRYQAVQAANDSLKVQILAAGGSIAGGPGGRSGDKASPSPLAVPSPPSSSVLYRQSPAASPGCRITPAAAAAGADFKPSPRTWSPSGRVGNGTIPAVRARPGELLQSPTRSTS